MKFTKKFMFIVSLIIILGGVVIMFTINGIREKKEADLNRKYEVSLVKALKNSYGDIREIKISNPLYTKIPRSWSCDVEIQFDGGETISYSLNHDLESETNLDGVMKCETNEKIDEEWEKLHKHVGKTEKDIIVHYSDGEKDI